MYESKKRTLSLWLCIVLAVCLCTGVRTEGAAAADTSLSIALNGSYSKTVGATSCTIAVSLTGANTNTIVIGKTDWITCTKKSNSSFIVTVAQNASFNSRNGSVTFGNASKSQTWTLRISQNGAKKPTNTPTPRPTNTPTPIPPLTISTGTINFSNNASNQSITLGNVIGQIRADQSSTAVGWLVVSGNGSNYIISANANTSYASRSGQITFTDTGTGKSVSVTVNQGAAPTPIPLPTYKINVISGGNPQAVPYTGSAVHVTFSGSNLSQITMTSSAPNWIVLHNDQTQYLGDGTRLYVFSVYDNKDYNQRNGYVTFSLNGKTICTVNINQLAHPRPTNTPIPTAAPTKVPTKVPTVAPTKVPTKVPTVAPTKTPTKVPTAAPTKTPTKVPTAAPTKVPTKVPTVAPTKTPTKVPTAAPTKVPTKVPTVAPTKTPTKVPTAAPTKAPTKVPTIAPIKKPVTSTADYVVSFDLNGGEVSQYQFLQKVSVKTGYKYGDGIKDGWLRLGYQFDGWYTKKEGGTKVTSETIVTINRNHTLYAHWTPNTYTIIYDSNGGFGTMNPQEDCAYDSTIFLKTCTYSKSGYKCIGWSTEKDGTGTRYACNSTVWNLDYNKNGEVTLYAVWGEPIVVSFDENWSGGQSYKNTLYIDKYFGTLPIPYREGFKFLGWYSSPTGGRKYSSTTQYDKNSDIVLYAHWQVTVKFADPELAEFGIEIKAAEGEQIIIPNDIASYETASSFLIGFSTSMTAERPDNGTSKRYQLPTGLTESTVYLFAVMAPPITTSGMANVGEKVLEYLKIISQVDLSSWNPLGDLIDEINNVYNMAQMNYEHNKQLVDYYTSIFSEKFLNGQNLSPLCGLKVGDKYLNYNGCGIIACYNAIHYAGKGVYLPDLIYYIETSFYLMQLPKGQYSDIGSFGLSPHSISNILSEYGVSSTSYKTTLEFINSVENAQGIRNQGFIVTVWNGSFFDGAHTMFLSTNDEDNTILVYNFSGGSSEPKKIYNIRELVRSETADCYILGYSID